MFDMFKKLLMAGQIKFEEGNITFLNSRITIVPVELLINLMERFKYDEKICLEFYKASRFTHIEGFAEEVSKRYNIRQIELAKWLINGANTGGWGIVKFTAEDDFNRMAVIEVRNGISKGVKSTVPVDHFLRGQIAGGASAAFNMNLDCIERRCAAAGDDYCEFVIKPRESFIRDGISQKFAKQIFSEDEIKKLKVKILK